MRKPQLRINTSLPPHEFNEVTLVREGSFSSYSKSKKKKMTSKRFSMYLRCCFLFILMSAVSIQLAMHENVDMVSFNVDGYEIFSFDSDNTKSFTLPEEPDLKTVRDDIQNLNDIIVLGKGESSPLENCAPTAQIKLYQMIVNGSTSWFIQTYDQYGSEKTVGGDEFYIDYTDEHPKHKQKKGVNGDTGPDAVAFVRDLKNGTYYLDFVSTPMSRVKKKSTLKSEGRIKVYFEYTCGVGMLPQPTKLNWKASGAMYQKPLYKDNFPRPSIRIFQPPRTPNLSSYSLVIFFGDSTMYQLAVKGIDDNGKKIFFRPNITYANNVRSQLTKDRMKKNFLRKLFIFHNKQLRDLDNVALVLGSSIWDLLIGDNIQGPDFDDHLEACRDLVKIVKERYPKVSLYWKGTSSLHAHRVNCTEANYDYQDCLNSTKYLSNSRVQRLEMKQRLLMKELKVPYLDVFPAYYLSAHFMAPGDGRHAIPSLNEKILNWFF